MKGIREVWGCVLGIIIPQVSRYCVEQGVHQTFAFCPNLPMKVAHEWARLRAEADSCHSRRSL
jgi:hypothetical protein